MSKALGIWVLYSFHSIVGLDDIASQLNAAIVMFNSWACRPGAVILRPAQPCARWLVRGSGQSVLGGTWSQLNTRTWLTVLNYTWSDHDASPFSIFCHLQIKHGLVHVTSLTSLYLSIIPYIDHPVVVQVLPPQRVSRL